MEVEESLEYFKVVTFCDGLFKFKKHKKCRKIVEKNILINHKNLKYYINNVNFSFVIKKYA